MEKWIELNAGELVNLDNVKEILKSDMMRDNKELFLIYYDDIDEHFCNEEMRDKRFEEIKAILLDKAPETDTQPVKVITATDIMIEEMDLSVRAYNCLKRAGVQTLDDIIRLGSDRLREVRNLGKKCYDEIVWILVNRYHQPQRNWGSDGK